MKRVIRHFRGCMPSAPAACLAEGWGRAFRSWDFVPEAQNDMIFSIICEELGLFGAGMILFLFLVLIWRFYVTASRCTDLFGGASGLWGDGPYDDPGDPEYIRCDQHDPQYRDHPAFCQLRRYIGGVSADRNGACIWRIISGKIRKTWYKGSIQMGKKKTKRKIAPALCLCGAASCGGHPGAERAGSFLCTAD